MLQLTHIEKTYTSGEIQLQALRDVNLHIRAGTMVALCGPSGSGKSTLLNICGLLDQDYSGEVCFSGEVMTRNYRQAKEIRRAHLGFVFQKFNLVPVMTAFENVAYPLLLNGIKEGEVKRRVMAMLDHVGLSQFAKYRPGRLSGGQQQRVAIARALVHHPRLVIADEPTASLDSVTAEQIIELMKGLGREQETAFIVASHDDRMTRHCDRIIDLIDGVIYQGEALCVA
ncbi:lipoprotein-releasing system ATP-binding protein LolD [Microbulbifer sp. A4B17]|uniref:ABC transporter ATP-binding protein n=1 Tax=Microbulbifer sp. A4B17 TaxID=359370 RepID=UPI000D52F07E|nr:ABC transporter ATP-binding protein [Microbulbifer sp. A4B17]AWF80695.1 lipoprotein-releasing system ATP-binding protein LolD [Microbulbifer sp. A4B17]